MPGTNELDSVTEILDGAGMIDSAFFTVEARERGTAVHLATQYDDEGTLDESTVPEILVPRLAGWRRFRREKRPEILAIELEVGDPVLGYVGHIDRIVDLDGKITVLDLKNGLPLAWHSIQLAAYAAAYQLESGTRPARLSVYLGDDDYRLVPYPDDELDSDLRVFFAALTLVNWRRRKARR